MAASKCNYVIVWKNSSQVYSTTNLETAVKTPIPKGCRIDDKKIIFLSYNPDEETLCAYPITQEQLDTAFQKAFDEEIKKQAKKEQEFNQSSEEGQSENEDNY